MIEQDRISSQSIAERLRELILTGDLEPGSRILQEQLAEKFGASRLPVRDALRRLEADGLVTIVANTGAWVSKLTEAECAEAYQIRERLEPLLLILSLPNFKAETLGQLEILCSEMEQAKDIETFLRLDKDFHSLAYSHAPEGMVKEIVERLWNTTQHYRRAFLKLSGIGSGSVTHLEHRLIVDAIRRADPVEIERVLGGHVRRTRMALVAHPEIFS